MYKYLKHILIYSLILVYSCTDKLKVHERISLTPAKQIPQTEETKNFNTIIHGFNKYIELAREAIIKHKSGKERIQDFDAVKTDVEKYAKFISWIEKNLEKKKELDEAWTEAYNLLEQRRAENAPEKTLKEYISDALDCAPNYTCQDIKKYGTQYNQIGIFFEKTFRDIFINYSDPEEIFIQFKTLDISEIKDNF
ncbi:Mlp family lipoprotein [Borrelia hispanica]|uniref:Mlp family lipoprotein n=1 Tax=Borrelia hispanica TaxID=40835 RepID=UPI0004633067|nr:Mlp family lipoprotein [Borrelia hispanica]